MQTVCILVAPALLAASLYMVFGRLVALVRAESLALVRAAWVTKIFVGGDLACFVVQVVGAATLASASDSERGKVIILVGLMAQIAVFTFFIVVAGVFHHRLGKAPTAMAVRLDARSPEKGNKMRNGWKGVMLIIYLPSGLIFVRSLFRFVEFVGPRDGPLWTSEAYLYLFDSLLMLGVLAVLIPFHPAQYVPGKRVVMREVLGGRDGVPLDG
jgi:hypothetical protein